MTRPSKTLTNLNFNEIEVVFSKLPTIILRSFLSFECFNHKRLTSNYITAPKIKHLFKNKLKMQLIRRFVITNNLGSFGDVTTRAAVLENNLQNYSANYSVLYYTRNQNLNYLALQFTLGYQSVHEMTYFTLVFRIKPSWQCNFDN